MRAVPFVRSPLAGSETFAPSCPQGTGQNLAAVSGLPDADGLACAAALGLGNFQMQVAVARAG